MHLAQAEQSHTDNKVQKMDEWLMAKKMNDAHQSAHLGNLDQVEQSEKKLRDQTNSRSFKEF